MLQGTQCLGLVVAVVHEDAADGATGGDGELRSVGTRSEAGQAIGDVERDVVLGAQQVHAKDAVQRLEQLAHVAETVPERQRPGVDVLDLRRAVTASGHQRGTQADEERQLDLVAVTTLGNLGNQRQPGREVGDRLVVGGAFEGPLTGQQPVPHGPLGQLGGSEVVGDDLWVDGVATCAAAPPSPRRSFDDELGAPS